ncbi:MAG: signal recognition particle receptor subunit alpha, partial [Pseudomonadota bacterium]|nr:signal recognition particle receptor subunit alpha [Pseudomonadota bacterium]
MFGFFKRKKKHDSQQEPQDAQEQPALLDEPEGAPDKEPAADVSAPSEPLAEEPPKPAPERENEPTEVLAQEQSPEPVSKEDVQPTGVDEEVTPAPIMDTVPEPEPAAKPALQEKPVSEKGEKKGWFARIKSGLGKTRANLTDGLADLFLGKKHIDDELLEDLETQLLMADVGIEATSEIIERLEARVSRKELNNPEALYRGLQEELAALLAPVSAPLSFEKESDGPFVILVVGVNGVGKTTTIGKLTQRFQREGKSVMLAAGDTFRAAAVEQLKVWGERNSVPVIAQHTGADSASVIYDAVAAAKSRGVDVLIADT